MKKGQFNKYWWYSNKSLDIFKYKGKKTSCIWMNTKSEVIVKGEFCSNLLLLWKLFYLLVLWKLFYLLLLWKMFYPPSLTLCGQKARTPAVYASDKLDPPLTPSCLSSVTAPPLHCCLTLQKNIIIIIKGLIPWFFLQKVFYHIMHVHDCITLLVHIHTGWKYRYKENPYLGQTIQSCPFSSCSVCCRRIPLEWPQPIGTAPPGTWMPP